MVPIPEGVERVEEEPSDEDLGKDIVDRVEGDARPQIQLNVVDGVPGLEEVGEEFGEKNDASWKLSLVN